MNKYKKAIEKNQVKAFFYGHGEYHYFDRDFPDTHSNPSTFMDVLDYFVENGIEGSLVQIKKDLQFLSETKPNPFELLTIAYFVFHIIKRYVDGKEAKIDAQWIKILDNVRSIYTDFDLKYGSSITSLYPDPSYINYSTKSFIDHIDTLIKDLNNEEK